MTTKGTRMNAGEERRQAAENVAAYLDEWMAHHPHANQIGAYSGAGWHKPLLVSDLRLLVKAVL